MLSATRAWQHQLQYVYEHGAVVSPRGMLTREVLHQTLEVDMRFPVVVNRARRLNYRFLAADAFWVLTGDNRVSEIARYGPQMHRYSDDGAHLAGAYGPHIVNQMWYIIETLYNDLDSRRAVLTTWARNPQHSLDIPCTVAMNFMVRDRRLHNHVFMRSSDQYLGLPYDIFVFSMIGLYVCAALNKRSMSIAPGTLYLTAASAHIYEEHWLLVDAIVNEPLQTTFAVPRALYQSTPDILIEHLKQLREVQTRQHPLKWWNKGEV